MKLLYIFIIYFFIECAFAFVPQEDLIFNDLTPQADNLIVFRPYDGKKYRLSLGVGCLPALFDDLTQNTRIYAVKLGDLLDPYGNGDIGLLYIETPFHKVNCKIITIQAY
jgi:hypothetical protein